jgi:hypothetical protein
LQYKNNYLDYATYKKLIDSLVIKAAPFGLNLTPLNPINPTALPSMVNDTLSTTQISFANQPASTDIFKLIIMS